LSFVGPNAFCDRMTAGYDDVIFSQVEPADGRWHQWQVAPIMPAGERQSLDEGFGDFAAFDKSSLLGG